MLDFTEGIGIIKTYNLLGEKSKTLTDSFVYSCERNLEFEEGHAPWARAVNLTYGLGSTAIAGFVVVSVSEWGHEYRYVYRLPVLYV